MSNLRYIEAKVHQFKRIGLDTSQLEGALGRVSLKTERTRVLFVEISDRMIVGEKMRVTSVNLDRARQLEDGLGRVCGQLSAIRG